MAAPVGALLPFEELPSTPISAAVVAPPPARLEIIVPGEWVVEPHLCLICMGRVLRRGTAAAERQYRCSNCGAAGTGLVTRPSGRRGEPPDRFPPICMCTARYGPRDAGLRCVANENRGITSPGEIIVREV